MQAAAFHHGQQVQQRRMLDEQMLEVERRRWLENANDRVKAKLLTPYERQMNKQLLHQVNHSQPGIRGAQKLRTHEAVGQYR